MKIITCLKEVPGRDTRYEINDSEDWIEEGDLTLEINECDEYALEEALKLADAHEGEVAILTAGGQRSEKSIRKGLAMGAGRAILVEDEQRRLSSPLAVAKALARVLKDEEYDLVLAGTQSDDMGHAQTGTMLAEMLGLPHATIVMEVEADPAHQKIKALREMESGWFQWLELPLPAVLTIQAGSSQVRYASLKGIMQAKKKEIRRVPLEELDIEPEELPGLEIKRLYFDEPESKAEMLDGEPAEVADALVEKLRKEARVLG